MMQAHPQCGSLSPIISKPFCDDPANCGNPEDLNAGTFTFGTDELDATSGYDVWLLNGLGCGIAGPWTIYTE